MAPGELHRLPAVKRGVVEGIVSGLGAIAGVEAIVLGGSYANGTARDDSDVDLGVYYLDGSPPAIASIRLLADRFSTTRSATVTELYEWGPWVNGGAWMYTDAGKVDLIYRSFEHLERVIADAHAGRFELHYYQQPTHGFHSVIYLAETSICVPLFDPRGRIARLKAQVATYPAALKAALLRDHLWGVEFTLMFARKFADQADAYNTVGCLTRGLNHLTQALFALNEVYFLTDKGVLKRIAEFRYKPGDYGQTVTAILTRPGADMTALRDRVGLLEELFRGTVALAGTLYQPKYSL